MHELDLSNLSMRPTEWSGDGSRGGSMSRLGRELISTGTCTSKIIGAGLSRPIVDEFLDVYLNL